MHLIYRQVCGLLKDLFNEKNENGTCTLKILGQLSQASYMCILLIINVMK